MSLLGSLVIGIIIVVAFAIICCFIYICPTGQLDSFSEDDPPVNERLLAKYEGDEDT